MLAVGVVDRLVMFWLFGALFGKCWPVGEVLVGPVGQYKCTLPHSLLRSRLPHHWTPDHIGSLGYLVMNLVMNLVIH